jgi:hypothetical protein
MRQHVPEARLGLDRLCYVISIRRWHKPVRAIDETGSWALPVQRFPALIDHPDVSMTEHDARIFVQHVQTTLQKERMKDIVARSPFQKRSGRELEHPIVIPRSSKISIAAEVTDPCIFISIRLA